MKVPNIGLMAILAGLLIGCATAPQTAILGMVGPAPHSAVPDQKTGELVVFSAWDVHPGFTTTDPERHRHSDYEIYSQEGKLLQLVRNDSGRMIRRPVPVLLDPGKYAIRARAAGCGWVKVPVLIASRQTTEVHLDGVRTWAQAGATDRLVRLPTGDPVGWEAAVLPR